MPEPIQPTNRTFEPPKEGATPPISVTDPKPVERRTDNYLPFDHLKAIKTLRTEGASKEFVQKYIEENSLQDNKTVKDFFEKLDKDKTTLKKYINGGLNEDDETITTLKASSDLTDREFRDVVDLEMATRDRANRGVLKNIIYDVTNLGLFSEIRNGLPTIRYGVPYLWRNF